MPLPPSQDETRQPAPHQNAEVEKLYESCCGSCGPQSTSNTVISLDVLTTVTKGTDLERKSGTP